MGNAQLSRWWPIGITTALTAGAAAQQGLVCEARDILSRTTTAGHAHDIAIGGNLAYIADGSAGLLVLDISEPAAPVFVASCDTPGSARALSVDGSHAFIAEYDFGLRIVDVADPGAPVLVGSLAMGATPLDVVGAGGLAYLALGDQGLVVVDVSEPTSPAVVGAYDTVGGVRNLAIVGEHAYLADTSGGLVIVDVSNPSAPTLVGASDAALVFDVAASGDVLYAATDAGVAVFDVADPASPQLLATNGELGDDDPDIVAAGGRAYLGGARTAYDVSDPHNPEPVGTFAHSGERAFIRGSLAFVAAGDEVLVVDVADPPSSTVLGASPAEDSMEGLAMQGHYAFVADWFGGMGVIDVSDPKAPVRVASLLTAEYAHDVAVQGDYAYIADDGAGFAIADISDPLSPVLLGQHGPIRGARVAVDGSVAAVLGGGGLEFVDVSDPLHPQSIATHGGYGGSRQHGNLRIVNGFAYVAGPDFAIFDVGNPAEPPIAEVHTPSRANAIDVQDDLACIGCHYELVLYDLSNLNNPLELGRELMPSPGVESVRMVDDVAIVGLFNGDLWVVDISDPSNPKSRFQTGGALGTRLVWDMEIRENLAYMVDADRGLVIVDLSDCPCPADFNGDGSTDSRDVIAFVGAWASDRGRDCSSGDCSTDLDGNGVADSRDVVRFLNLWAGGC
ncbi:MAG TPA: GC-type dockerin domain-anchored protein [Phycisphaerales bacterium]|nr:GC-type dockerin domain-anchored protein [Phycisphaerales bacterium]